MVMEGKKPRLNNNNTDDFVVVDRISDLPDSILGHILSFLPTDSAVATSILSKRWKFAWVTVNNLDFSNRGEEEEEEYMEFVRFVDRVLLLNEAGSLNKFRLNCGLVTIPPEIDLWIDTAISKNVNELYLFVGDMVLPTSLFTCDSLRSMELRGTLHCFLPTAVCLPRLESLKINSVNFVHKKTCEKLISGCPILHHLNLVILNLELYDRGDDDIDYEDPICIISSPSLRRLEIYFKYTSRLKLKVSSSLEYFRLGGGVSKIFVDNNSLSSLVQADLDLKNLVDEDDIRYNSIVEVVRAFDCVKSLTLSTDVMQALGRATINLSTEFKRLVKFVAGSYTCSVQDFIQNSENLEDVIINQNSTNRARNSRWITPIEVPRCLSKTLKKVQLYGCRGFNDEYEMIRYMLEHGSALEVMQIHFSCYLENGEKFQLIHEIREFPMKSRVCDVQFTM